jgi:hypothetical protein
MRLHQAQGWATQYSIQDSTGKANAWLTYLTKLNIVQFRADIAQHLLLSNKKYPELRPNITATAAATTAFFTKLTYCAEDMWEMFEVDGERVPPHTATSNKTEITSTWALLQLLFGWEEEMQPEEKKREGAWRRKTYRLVLQKSFYLIKAVLGLAAAQSWYHQLLVTVMLTSWVLPYATATAFLPLTKTNRAAGLRARTIWFSSVFQEGVHKWWHYSKGSGEASLQVSPLLLGDITRQIKERSRQEQRRRDRRGGGSGGRSPRRLCWKSAEHLVATFAELSIFFPQEGRLKSDTEINSKGFFRLGRVQAGTRLIPLWESGRPIPLQHISQLPMMSLHELDEFIQQEMEDA